MGFFEDFLLGVIQAILEWLPVSSEGFLLLVAVNLFGEPAQYALRLAIYFHFGTALSVLFKYRQTYWDAVFKPENRDVLRFLIISTLFTGVVGIPVYLLLKEAFTELNGLIVSLLVGFTLLVTGWLIRMGKLKGVAEREMDQRSVKDEIYLGVAQGFAILPGISRSGITTTLLIFRGFKKEDAFKMSFLISLPAVAGAIAFDLFFEDTEILFSANYLIIVAIVAILGYLTMEGLLKFAKNVSFDRICFILGIITILLVSILLIVV